MKNKRLQLIFCLALPLAVGLAASWVSGGSELYDKLILPPLSPPGWVFPAMWTALYLLMGYASYLVHTSGMDKAVVNPALGVYLVQLFLHFLWPVVFFGLVRFAAAFLVLVLLWIAIFITIRRFFPISPLAGKLLIPYLIWVSFAGYLNAGVWLLNQSNPFL